MDLSVLEVRNRLSSLHGQIQQLVDESGTAGLSIGVLHEGKAVYTSHYGHRNLRTKEAPNDDTVYHLGSLSKALVASAVGVLVSQGKLTWDVCLRDLKDIEPQFHQRDKVVESEANLIDFLAHRMGLSMRMNYWAQMQQELLLQPNEAINVLGDLQTLADFRTTIKYNNWSYAVLVLLIEKLTEQPIEEFMQDTFFKPLGLQRTTFANPPQENHADAHITLSDGTPYEVPNPRIGNGTLLCGAAGLKSSVGDLLIIYEALLSALKDQAHTGQPSTPGNPFKEVAAMFTSHNKKGSTEYGLGWFLTELPADIGWIGINDGRVKENPIIGKGLPPTPIAYHNGNMPGYISSVHLVPSTNTIIVILSNTLAFSDLPDYVGGLILNTVLGSDDKIDFVSLVRECKEASIQGPLKTAAQLQTDREEGTTHKSLGSYTGRYVNTMGNFALIVTVQGDGLRLRINDLPETYYDLKHYHHDTFAWECDRDAEAKRAMFPQLSVEFRKIHFLSDDSGVITSIHWTFARDEPKGEVFRRVRELGSHV